jgi:opacity protein-like surface antigen
MSKFILKILFVSMLVMPVAFADVDNELGPFDQQGDNLSNSKPKAEESFFATRGHVPGTLRRYFGLNIGTGLTSFKPTITGVNNSGINVGTQALSTSAPAVSYVANIYGGLGTNFDNFYIGTELSGGYNTLDRTLSTTNFAKNATITLKQPITVGLDIIPGFLTQQKDFLFYGRLGIGTSLLNFRIDNIANSAVNLFVFDWRAGLGVEYFISEAFSMRLDYVYATYSNINQTYAANNVSTNYTYNIPSLYTQQITLGLAINF